jgi:hypothetical protein
MQLFYLIYYLPFLALSGWLTLLQASNIILAIERDSVRWYSATPDCSAPSGLTLQ